MEIFGRYIGKGTWAISKENGHVIIVNNGGEYQFQTGSGAVKSNNIIDAFWMAYKLGKVADSSKLVK